MKRNSLIPTIIIPLCILAAGSGSGDQLPGVILEKPEKYTQWKSVRPKWKGR